MQHAVPQWTSTIASTFEADKRDLAWPTELKTRSDCVTNKM